MGPPRILRTFLTCSLLACRFFGTLTAAADPAGVATAATTSDFEVAQQPDSSAEVAPVTAAPSPAAADAPTAPGPDRHSASEPSKVAEPPRADPPSQAAQPADREWYGLPLLLVDGVYLGM